MRIEGGRYFAPLFSLQLEIGRSREILDKSIKLISSPIFAFP
jgi:hypothetical protein